MIKTVVDLNNDILVEDLKILMSDYTDFTNEFNINIEQGYTVDESIKMSIKQILLENILETKYPNHGDKFTNDVGNGVFYVDIVK
jgi:hypothetical protein